ncbi:S1 family peptidase [Puniceicoccus vermicola]|uniref:Trypsin-like peptidase domain-containing protein n=1 Tax=Puniceicoccus vermicola TaxID=388746 RepID=A0A7X1AWJ9_9BACT|nr:serine protease [Puniceicoccus vermicola]MBC2601298.1 trypsin-like peptidase domain-containing protein [Puniceicoccus vermicola]
MSARGIFDRFIRRPLILGGLFMVVCLRGEEETYSEWTGIDGRTLEARINFVEKGLVRMERVDGVVFDIPIERFAEKDRSKILAWKPPQIEVPEADDAVLVLETENGRGSGFLVQSMGEVWVYTNQHVIGDASSVRAMDTHGNEIELGRLEIAKDRDIARFRTSTNRGLELSSGTKTGEKIVVFGNSQGTGVITRSKGEVLGISWKTVEVSAEIVSGNSGGPVMTEEGEVLGISTYVQFGEYSADRTVEDTRYEKPRRFALRLDRPIDFVEVTRWDYEQVYNTLHEHFSVFDESFAFAMTILSDPTGRVMTGNFDSSEVVKIAEDHNDDVARIPGLASSGISYRSKVRKISSRFIDTLEDAYRVGENSLKEARFSLRDERFGWFQSQIKEREEMQAGLKQEVERVENSFN